jgi:hypothetical protein
MARAVPRLSEGLSKLRQVELGVMAVSEHALIRLGTTNAVLIR